MYDTGAWAERKERDVERAWVAFLEALKRGVNTFDEILDGIQIVFGLGAASIVRERALNILREWEDKNESS